MAIVAENETAQAAAASDHNDDSPPAAAPKRLLDPQLLMAARRGDSEELKELLLRLMNNGDQDRALEAAAASEVVIVEVVPRRRSPSPAAAPPPPPPPPPTASRLAALPPPLVDGVTSEGDTLLHVVAACGDGEDFLRCSKMIVNDYKLKGGAAAMRLALEARNSNGDTPLHCAAAAGNANMISCLIDLVANTNEAAAAASVKALARTQNKRGETALHQAVRAAKNKVACIDHLMDVDPELACIPLPHHQEEEDAAGASPLYLAISLGEIEIAQHLYVKSKGKLSYSGPHGRNVLHAAVRRGQALPMILKWLIKDGKEDGPVNMQGGRHMMTRNNSTTSSVSSLVSQLTSQRDKKHKGSTPLHLAASLNGWPGAGFLSSRFPKVWPTAESVATLLLDANESTAYQADDQGWYPIHVAAASSDSLGLVKVLLERCPDCATLRDGKGRTFLHVAAEMKNHSPAVVQYVCGEMPQQLSSMILNVQDSNGDTALHGAVRAGNLAGSTCLLRNRLVRLDVANKDGTTPLDLSWTTLPSGFTYAFNPRQVVRMSLLYSGAPHGGGRSDLFYEKHTSERDVVEESKKYTEATQVTSIVTALIATVAFASAFTLPGGYRADGAAAAGTAVLAGKSYAFNSFILADTLAFIFSMAATCSLVYAGLPVMDISIRNYYFNISALLLQSAARSLVAAFGLALYLVLAPVDHKTAVAVCAFVFATSLYGNMGTRQVTHVANTARTRIGMRLVVVCFFAIVISSGALVHFGSYLIIFGLPAILKLAR